MNFGLNKEHKMLQKSYSEFLSKECPLDVVREIKRGNEKIIKRLWQKIAKLGWLGLIFDANYGGFEGSFMDLFILFEEIGKFLFPSPLLFGNVLPGLLLQNTGSDDNKDGFLPSLIKGKTIITLALFDKSGTIDKDQPRISALRSGDHYILNGTRLLVPHVNLSDAIIVCADVKGNNGPAPTLMIVNMGEQGITVTPVETITDEKSYVVQFDNLRISKNNIIGDIGKGSEALDRILPIGTVLKCGEMIGGLNRVLDMTLDYAKNRNQFGRPIGSFQAVQHFCADMAIYLEGGKLITYHAASLISQNQPCTKEVAMAKAWCSDVYKESTRLSQQIHGAIGFTEEFNIQLYYKHAKESELLFGHAKDNRSIIADLIGL